MPYSTLKAATDPEILAFLGKTFHKTTPKIMSNLISGWFLNESD